MNKYRIIHLRERCIGCNACKEAAPGRWQMSRSDGKSTLIGSTHKKKIYTTVIDEAELEENMLALKNCPVHIIQVFKINSK
jgi:ferredoxin